MWRGTLDSARRERKAGEWWDDAVKRGNMDSAKRSGKAGEWWDDAVSRGNMDSAKRSGKADDWWDSAVRKGNLDRNRDTRSRQAQSDSVSADMDALFHAEMRKSNDREERVRVAQARERDRARRAQEAEEGKPGILGNFGMKLGAVAMYHAAASTVYGALHALKSGAEGAIHTDREMAMIGGIFRGAPGEYRALTRDVLSGASEQGRTSEEGLAAAMKFSHLGLSRSSTASFTTLSMKGANIAGIGAEESAHAIASYTEAFHLGVGEATTALDRLNSVANHSNVTIKELMEVMGRTGAIAKASGFDMTEYASLLAGGAGKTGLPVNQFAGAFGLMLTNSNDPNKQKVMHQRYGVEVFTPGGEKKTGPQLADAINKRFHEMSPDAGIQMLSNLAGPKQAQRLAAIFEGYDESKARAIAAMRDIGSAQNQNNNILDTTSAKLAGVSAAWTAMWHSAQQGGLKTVTNGLLGLLPRALSGFDRLTGQTVAGFGDLYDTVIGESSRPSRVVQFKDNQKLDKDLQREQADIEVAVAGVSRGEGLAKASFMEASMFRDAARRIDDLNPEQARALMGALAKAHGGNPDQVKETKRSLLGAHADGTIREKLMSFAEEAKTRWGHDTESHEKNAERLAAGLRATRALAQGELEAEDAVPPITKTYPGHHGKPRVVEVDQRNHERITMLRQRIADLDAQMDALDDRRKHHRDFEWVEQASDGTQSMRRDVPLRLHAISSFFEGLPVGGDSDRRKAQMARDREQVAAQRALALDMERKVPGEHENDFIARSFEAGKIKIAANDRAHALDIREPSDRQHDAAMRGVRMGNNSLGGFGAGLNETERLMDSVRGIQGMVPGITQRRGMGGADGEKAAGEAMAANIALTHNLEALETRRLSVQREFNQLKMEENKHAAEGLAFASRSDQLTAAIFQRRLLTKGQMTPAEAIMYSPDTLRAIKERVPGALPFGARAEKEREMARIGPAIEDAKARAAAIRPALDAAQKLPAIQFPQVLQGATVPVTIVNGVVQPHDTRTQKTAQPGAGNPPAVVDSPVPAKAVVVDPVPAKAVVVDPVPAPAAVVPPADKVPAPKKAELTYEEHWAKVHLDNATYQRQRTSESFEEEKQAKRDAIIQAANDQMDATTGPKPAFDFNKNFEDIRGTYDTWFPKSAKTKRDNLSRLRDEEKKKLFDQYPGESLLPYFEGASSLDYAVENENRERKQRAWDKKISKSLESNKQTTGVPKPSALEALLSKEPGADIEAERKIGASRLNPSELPGFRETFTEVQKFMGEMYGKDASQFGMPELAAYGKRGQAYNVAGEYHFETNSLSLSRDSMERFSKGDPDAKNTVRHELTHYFQDKMAGDVKSLDKLRGTGIEDVNKKLRGMGLTPEKGGSSEHQKGYEAQAYEEMAEMAAGYFERKTSGSTGPKSGSGGNTLQRFRGPGVDAAQALPPIQFPAMNVNVDAGAQVGELWNKAQQFMENVVNSRFQAMTERMEAFAHAVGGGVLQGAGSDTILGAD